MINKIIFAFTSIALSVNLYGQTIVKKVKPSDTDPLITTFNVDSNYVYLNTAVTSKNILVVHLPGSYGEPKRATLYGTLAADLGFHSIGLMYPNIPTVGSICSSSSDAYCYDNVRREIIEGVDYSTGIAINSTECIFNRLKKLLTYLTINYPTENWGQYLDINGDLIFNKIIFSGHSQGGGHAALIGKYYPIKRAVCFSSPKDWSNFFGSPPLWLSPTGWQTSPNNIYCFNHTLDEHTRQLEIWNVLGIDNFGAPINVDINSTPYSNTRQLTTTYSVPVSDEHACTIQDNKTPKIAGIPVFIPVWTYMLTDNLTTGLSNNSFDSNFSLQLIPNPTNDFVTLELTDENHFIKIYDQTGKCMLEQNSTTGKTQINLTTLTSGLYFIVVSGGKKTYTGKVIKQ
ncbi:MAG: T9SS type A sorting domain-containing protein [Flavobacterium sp.]|nr:T9SS type A sorting domain-containing protein [Flavobacterium sp.]